MLLRGRSSEFHSEVVARTVVHVFSVHVLGSFDVEAFMQGWRFSVWGSAVTCALWPF